MSDTGKAVFLSYASQDAEAAKRIADALRAAGVEVWFDQNELVGGDAWDQKIRRQIKDCALLIPIISENTQQRTEGYFRLEWRLADQRTHLMAKGRAFLLPVVVDDTSDADAAVPDSFLDVQWTRLRPLGSGEASPAGSEDPVLAKFVARVRDLLSADPAARAKVPRFTGQWSEGRTNNPEPVINSRRLGRLWWALPIFGVAMALLLVMKEGRKDPAPPPAMSPPASLAPVSEAQKLVQQARKIYEDGDELNRENLYLAEELVQRALKLEPTEPTAWELSAWLSYMMVWHLIDESPERRENLLRQASRAVALAPESVAAQLVYANAQMAGRPMVRDSGPSHLDEIEQSLQRLAEREPQNWKIQRALGTVYRMMNRTDDAIRILERAVELSNDHPMAIADLVNLLIRRQRFAQAEALLAHALPQQRSGRLLTFDVVVKCRWRGDTVGALKAIETWPAWLLQENRGLAVAWQASFWGRQPEAALRVVQRFPGEEVRDVNFAGPRAVLSARAHELAGDAAAARADWLAVEQRCNQALAANPQDIVALHWKAWALARLGDQTGAQAAATLMRQHLQSVASSFFNVNTVAPLWATVGWTDLALVELKTLLDAPVDGYSLTRAYLELEPAFDPLRQDPRFQALVAQAPTPTKTEVSTPIDQKSVAVLAFANLSDDKTNEYFSDGISEELLNVLAKVPGLKVTARTSSFHFKGKDTPIPEIAQQLGVAYVVEGSVRKAGDKVRITAQLIKAADGFHVWSDTFTRDLKDIFAVQDEIAGLIAKNLELKLGAVRSGEVDAAEIEAYRLYWEARQAWNRRNPASYDQAEALLNRALKLAPRFAKAHAALADVWELRGEWDDSIGIYEDRDGPAIRRLLAKVDEALALDPQCAEAYASRGNIMGGAWQFAAAEKDFQTAIALNPNFATAHQWFGRHLMSQGRMDEALAELKRATELDPLSQRILDNYAWVLRHAGRYSEALVYVNRALALQPDAVQARSLQAVILADMGRNEEAMAALRAVPDDVAFSLNFRLAALGRLGRKADLERLLPTIRDTTPRDRCLALAWLGRPAEVLATLKPERIFFSDVDLLLYEPVFDSLRSHPEWQTAMAAVGLTDAQARATAWRQAHPPEKPEAREQRTGDREQETGKTPGGGP